MCAIRGMKKGDTMYFKGDYNNNVIYGTEYDDTIDGVTGNDVLVGKGGNDTFLVTAGKAPIITMADLVTIKS